MKGSRFLAVGSGDDIRPLATTSTEVIDAEGMTVTPGFIDAHSHPSGAGVDELLHVNIDLRGVSAIQEALRKRANETPPGEWVIGFKYDDTKLDEGRPINRRDLDEIAPDHPVEVRHRGGYTAVYNSKAFQLAGITARTPDPPGGRFYREDGELSGLVAEYARAPLRRLIPSGSTREQRQAGVKLISELMTASGLTSVHQTGGGTDDLIAYQDAYAAGQLHFRMYLFPSGRSTLYKALKDAGIRTGFGDGPLAHRGRQVRRRRRTANESKSTATRPIRSVTMRWNSLIRIETIRSACMFRSSLRTLPTTTRRALPYLTAGLHAAAVAPASRRRDSPPKSPPFFFASRSWRCPSEARS